MSHEDRDFDGEPEPGLIVEHAKTAGVESQMHGLERSMQQARTPWHRHWTQGPSTLSTVYWVQHGATLAAYAHAPALARGEEASR
jgi:hypothetical protein